MKCLATVLWEDQYAESSPRSFGPHQLLLQLVADEVSAGRDGWSYKHEIECRPQKGNANLLKSCRKVDDVAPDCHPVIAVFDADKIRGPLRLSATATNDEVVAAIVHATRPPANKLHVVLLDPNIEAVVNVAFHGLATGQSSGPAQPTNPPKDRITRDRILMNAASPQMRGVRARIVESLPTVAYLRDVVLRVVTARPQRHPS